MPDLKKYWQEIRAIEKSLPAEVWLVSLQNLAKGHVGGSMVEVAAVVAAKLLHAKSQRLAWSIGAKKNVVFEAGLSNLTRPQTTAVVHYGKEKTIQMVLVRLDKPEVRPHARDVPTNRRRREPDVLEMVDEFA